MLHKTLYITTFEIKTTHIEIMRICGLSLWLNANITQPFPFCIFCYKVEIRTSKLVMYIVVVYCLKQIENV